MQTTKLSGQPVICQLLSFVPKGLVGEAAAKFGSDRYYKTMTCYRQLVFMLYGVISESPSLNGLCKSLLFLDGKLSHLGITELPAPSTLSDANRNRDSAVFEHLYYLLLEHYKGELKGGFPCLPINGEAPCDTVSRFDATTFTLFTDIFKGAGRLPLEGRKKGGVKAQALLPYDGLVPEHIVFGPAAKNDKDYLGQLTVQKGHLYVFDKGYINYEVYRQWTLDGVYFVTRLSDNASYRVVSEAPVDHLDIANGLGVLRDQVIELKVNHSKTDIKLRLVTYRDPISGKVLKFLTNHLGYKATTISLIYRNRWAIEPFFKQIKQNFQLDCFFSDGQQGILTQIWMALIANLIFTVIFQRIKQNERFLTMVTMARCNLGSFVCFMTILKPGKLSAVDRDNGIVQLQLFEKSKGGVLGNMGESP